jgi:hypothetical protein
MVFSARICSSRYLQLDPEKYAALFRKKIMLFQCRRFVRPGRNDADRSDGKSTRPRNPHDSVIPKKPTPHLMRRGYRFSEDLA